MPVENMESVGAVECKSRCDGGSAGVPNVGGTWLGSNRVRRSVGESSVNSFSHHVNLEL